MGFNDQPSAWAVDGLWNVLCGGMGEAPKKGKVFITQTKKGNLVQGLRPSSLCVAEAVAGKAWSSFIMGFVP